jgi:hypothetical protein
VSTGGNEVLDGTTPPRIAIVDGGTNTVVCSWRGDSGIGASGVHEGDRREGGADDAAATSRPAANKVGLNMEKCIVIVKILRWYAREAVPLYDSWKATNTQYIYLCILLHHLYIQWKTYMTMLETGDILGAKV